VEGGGNCCLAKGQIPTEKEQDHQWALKDPMGHWEAHKDDKQTKAGK
jgi:hypothetical protein